LVAGSFTDISRYVQASHGPQPLSWSLMRSLTVDLVVSGDESAAGAAARNAVQRGQRVLVVLRTDNPRKVPRLRRLCRGASGQLIVMASAEVVCVDGVNAVEAVVIRRVRSGRLCAVNASAFLSCDDSDDDGMRRSSDRVTDDTKKARPLGRAGARDTER
jgi:hypothetical protein